MGKDKRKTAHISCSSVDCEIWVKKEWMTQCQVPRDVQLCPFPSDGICNFLDMEIWHEIWSEGHRGVKWLRMVTFSNLAPDFSNATPLSCVCTGWPETWILPNPCFKWNFYLFYMWGLPKEEYMKTDKITISFLLKINWPWCPGQFVSEEPLLYTNAYPRGKYIIILTQPGCATLPAVPSSYAVHPVLGRFPKTPPIIQHFSFMR